MAENPYLQPPGKMKDQLELRKLLLHNLHPIVAHEQGITLTTAAGVRMLTHPTAMLDRNRGSTVCLYMLGA